MKDAIIRSRQACSRGAHGVGDGLGQTARSSTCASVNRIASTYATTLVNVGEERLGRCEGDGRRRREPIPVEPWGLAKRRSENPRRCRVPCCGAHVADGWGILGERSTRREPGEKPIRREIVGAMSTPHEPPPAPDFVPYLRRCDERSREIPEFRAMDDAKARWSLGSARPSGPTTSTTSTRLLRGHPYLRHVPTSAGIVT